MATSARVLDQKYRLGNVLRRSERAVVVAATHLELREQVVIKVLDPEHRDPRFAARLRREARQAAAIHSEHVPRFLDIGHLTDGRPYVVMERLEGETLAEQIASSGPLSLAATADVVMQTCEALAAAHARGILHRDIRPSNLFATKQPGGRTSIKVLNFGTARAIDAKGTEEDQGLTIAVLALDAPDYKAPEQVVARRDLDPRVDIWGLGVVIYELLTGQKPFPGASPQEIVRRILTADIAPPPAPDLLPPDVWAVVQGCLRARPTDRWSSVAEIADAIAPRASADTSSYPARIRSILAAPPPTDDVAAEENEPPTVLRDVLALTREASSDTQTRRAVGVPTRDTHSGLPRLDDGRTNARSFPWLRVDELKKASRDKQANSRKWVVAAVFFATLFVATTALILIIPRFVVDLHVETRAAASTQGSPTSPAPPRDAPRAPPMTATAPPTAPAAPVADEVPPPVVAPQQPAPAAAAAARAPKSSSTPRPTATKHEDDPWGWER